MIDVLRIDDPAVAAQVLQLQRAAYRVEADLIGLPSATVICAEIDPLRSEGELLAERLEQAGVDVRHRTFHGSTHEFFGMGLVVPDAAAAQTFAAHELKRAFDTAVLPI